MSMTNPNGADIYEPSRDECEALARKFHPDFTWEMLREDERKGLLDEWRDAQFKREPPKPTHAPPAATTPTAVSQAELVRVVDSVKKLVELQPLATKAGAQLAIRTVGRVLRPILAREQSQRADLQRDVAHIRREWAEQARHLNNLLGGLLSELCLAKRDEIDDRAQRLNELEARVDAAIAELARR